MAKETNEVCEGDGETTAGLGKVIGFSIITLGIYSIVWAYKLIKRRGSYLEKNGQENNLTTTFFLVAIFVGPLTLGILTMVGAARFIHQQNRVNAHHNSLKGAV